MLVTTARAGQWGPDRNTLLLKKWLKEDSLHKSVLKETMRDAEMDSSVTMLLYDRHAKPTRELMVTYFGLG